MAAGGLETTSVTNITRLTSKSTDYRMVVVRAPKHAYPKVYFEPKRNFLTANVYANDNSLTVVKASGVHIPSHVFQISHSVCDLCLVKATPGRPAIEVQSAVFEHRTVDRCIGLAWAFKGMDLERRHRK